MIIGPPSDEKLLLEGIPKIVRVGVAVLVRNSKRQILFGLRKGPHGGGTWSFPGGHVEHGEEPWQAAQRELLEEAGLVADDDDLRSVPHCPYVSHVFENGRHYITLYFEALHWHGALRVREPNKCERWEWRAPDDIPSPLFEPIEIDMLRLREDDWKGDDDENLRSRCQR